MEAILDAAENLLERYGYKRMTMDDLAHAVGMSKGALYLRFESKEQVALSMIDRLNQRVRQRLEHVLEQPIELRERVVQFLVQRIMVKYDSVRRYCASFDEVYAALRPEIVRRREKYALEEARLLSTVLQQGEQRRIFLLEDPLETAQMLLLATNALLPYRLNPDELAKRKELLRRCEALAEFLVLALMNPVQPEDSDFYGAKN